MYVTVARPGDPGEIRRLVVWGICFVTVILSLIAVSIAIYNKTFVSYTVITLEADRAGLQLSRNADVRYHGVIVGRVREIDVADGHAEITVGLTPGLVTDIPANVEASIIPTTLFGAKFVNLEDPGSPEGSIEAGDVIPTDRVRTSVELGTVLANLFPLLRAVRPADLNATLTALATALDGQGEGLGTTLVRLDDYLGFINGQLPVLSEDLALTAEVAEVYGDAAPEILAALENLTVTARTIATKDADINATLTSLTDATQSATRLLVQNEDGLVRFTHGAEPVLRLFARYSPELSCVLEGQMDARPVINKVFEGGAVRQFVVLPVGQLRPYDATRDRPVYGDQRGPQCYGLPDHPDIPTTYFDNDDGTDLDTAEGRGPFSLMPSSRTQMGALYSGLFQGPSSFTGRDETTTEEYRDATARALSRRSGEPETDVSDLATFLYGAMLTHAEVAR